MIKVYEKHFFFNTMLFQGQKDIYQNLLRAAPLCQLNQTYMFIMLDQKGCFFFIKTHFKAVLTGKAFKHCRFELRLQISLYDQNLAIKKEDFRLKSDLVWQNPFLKLWKLKFIIIPFGFIRFWSIFLCFCVRYKVFCVLYTQQK